MNTERIKLDLIAAISQTNNPNLLFEMSKLLDMSPDEEAIELSQNQIEEIKNVLFEVEEGKFVSHEEHKNKVNEWLKD